MRIKVGDKFQILKAGPWNSSVNTEGTIIRIDRILDGGRLHYSSAEGGSGCTLLPILLSRYRQGLCRALPFRSPAMVIGCGALLLGALLPKRC